MYNYKRTKYTTNMRTKKRIHNHSSKNHHPSSPIRNGIDPFDPRYAHVPLDVPIAHVEDYVKRKNNRNDQDHLQSQIMYFKKEFGCLPIIKSSTNTSNSNNNDNNNSTTMTSSSSTSTQIESMSHTNTMNASSTQTQDDHKDDNNDDDEHNMHMNDIILPSYDSLNSFRTALARYEAWQLNHNYNNTQLQRNTEDFDHIPITTQALNALTNSNPDENNNAQYQYVAPFYNPFLRINILETHTINKHNDDDEDTKHEIEEEDDIMHETHYGLPQHDTIFPLSHYQQNRSRSISTNTATNHVNEETLIQNDAYQRYRQYHRYRHSFRALQYHNIRRRLWTQSRMNEHTNGAHDDNNQNSTFYVMPQYGFDDNDTAMNAAITYTNINQNMLQNMNSHQYHSSNGQNWSRISNILTFNGLSDDDNDHMQNNNNNNNNDNNDNNNNVKLKVISPKLKHNANSSRLDGLQDFKAATALIPLRLTSLQPFKQRIFSQYDVRMRQKEEMDDEDCDWNIRDIYDDDDIKVVDKKEDKIVISGIDRRQNLLSQLSSDLHLIILNMLTGLGNVRTMALYKSLRSQLTEFDIQRVRNCSVYKCQALFVERYRQNLFDEKYKALHQPALTRALSCEPRNLSEFQRDRKTRILRKQYSDPRHNKYNQMDDDEKAPAI